MKYLHAQPEVQEQIVNKITSWYAWCLENVNNPHEQKVVSSQIGHISSKQMSVKITLTDREDRQEDIYVTPESWWVKKMSEGKAFGNFSKKLVKHID